MKERVGGLLLRKERFLNLIKMLLEELFPTFKLFLTIFRQNCYCDFLIFAMAPIRIENDNMNVD